MKRISHRNILTAFSVLGLLLLPGVDLYQAKPVSDTNAKLTEAGLAPARDFDLVTQSVFTSALATAYLDLAASITEAQGATWGDAQYFVMKAVAAREGNVPLPEHLDNWMLTEDQLETLASARLRLLDTINGDDFFMGQDVAPHISAKAQAYFDCWVQQSEEGLMGASGETCRSTFERALQSIDDRIIAARQLTLAMASRPASASDYTGSIGN